ncbi:MAG: hypothetical protein ACLP5V_16105 [Candidatus Bathyarchaeia archaeon]
MSDKGNIWTLGIQLNRKIGDTVYSSLRLYVPNNKETKPLLEKLQAEGGEDSKLYFEAKIHGSRIILNQVRPEPKSKTTVPNLSERADRIISIVAQEGGTSTWPSVREKLGLPSESTPGPFLVKRLRDKGLLTIKNSKTSTMTWKLINREKLNGYTSIQTTRYEGKEG